MELYQNQENQEYRQKLPAEKRIVVKVGSSSLLHPQTQRLDYHRIDRLAGELSDLKNAGKDVILVSSGAAAAGREALGINTDVYHQEIGMNIKQACAAVGQARLIQIYQKFFSEYNQTCAQVLMTKELLRLGVIPIVNENDSVAVNEFIVGDNDNLSAMVASVTHADLLILLSDVEGLYTDDPRKNPHASFIECVPKLDETFLRMGKKSTGSAAGTGGMDTKLHAARIATASGCDMVICTSAHGMGIIRDVATGKNVGTLFAACKDADFKLDDYIRQL